MYRNILSIMIAITIIVFAFISCSTKDRTVGDGGFLSDQKCLPSCFMGIQPGVTKEAEAIQILKENGYSGNCTFYNPSSESETHGVVCGMEIAIRFNNSNNIVEGVGFRPSVEITLKQVIDKYGDPDGIATFIEENPESIAVSLFYNELNAKLDLLPHEGKAYLVDPSNKITNISYSELNFFVELLRQSDAQPWKGYGTYTP